MKKPSTSLVAFALAFMCMPPLFAQVDDSGNLARNPIIWADVPDLAAIRVGDTYYMSNTTVVLPKNSIRRLYQPTGHTSNWVASEEIATKKHRIPRESGRSTITPRPVVTNQPGKPMFTITQHASIGDAIRRPAEWR